MTYKSVAINASNKAARLLMSHFRKLKPGQVSTKKDHEFVTVADYAAEKIILREIKKYFPDHRILSEEKGRLGKGGDYLWAVDPLDGTTNFTIGNPLFSVSITLFYKDEPVLGVVNAPFLGEIYVAIKNKGAFLNNKKIHVSRIRKVNEAKLTFCHGHSLKARKKSIKVYSTFKTRAAGLRQLGSAAIEHAFVACGRLEAIMINDTNPWDVGAGALLVREAGGEVTDYKGKRWDLQSIDILASNGKVHDEVLRCLGRISW